MADNLPATFVDRVKERVNEHIVGLVPDEELSKLVQAQVEHFQRTILPSMIKEAIKDEFAKSIKTEFQKPEYQATFASGGMVGASEAVSKIVMENAPMILSNMIGSMVQQQIFQMQQNVQRF